MYIFIFRSAFEEAVIIDWKEKLVGFDSNRASVNMGCGNGVAALLQKELNHPLISIHCVAHRLELGIVKAINTHQKMEQILKNMYDQ